MANYGRHHPRSSLARTQLLAAVRTRCSFIKDTFILLNDLFLTITAGPFSRLLHTTTTDWPSLPSDCLHRRQRHPGHSVLPLCKSTAHTTEGDPSIGHIVITEFAYTSVIRIHNTSIPNTNTSKYTQNGLYSDQVRAFAGRESRRQLCLDARHTIPTPLPRHKPRSHDSSII